MVPRIRELASPGYRLYNLVISEILEFLLALPLVVAVPSAETVAILHLPDGESARTGAWNNNTNNRVNEIFTILFTLFRDAAVLKT